MADSNAVQLNYDLVPSPQAASKLQRQMQDLERNLRFKGPFGPAVREVKDFGSELDRANQRVITLGASFAVLSTGLRTLKDIVRSTIEIEKAFTEINAVFGLSAKGLDQFSKQLFNTARDTAQSFEKAASAAKEFSRQGLTAQETISRTRDALILTRLANLDVAKSVETLTASMNGFQKSALTSTEIVNKLATVDARFAVSSADLAEALARSGAAASDAGVSFDQLIGIVTAAQQTTARGGSVIGNSLKTIFTRVERSDTIDAFRALGVEVEDNKGAILGAIPLLQNFAKTYDGLNGALKKQAAEMVGGVYQINILKAVLGDLAKAQGIAAQATDISANATNEAIKRNEALNQSLDSMLAKLGVTAKQIGANIGSQSFANPLKSLLTAVQNNPVTAALEDASGKAETIGGKIGQELLQGIGGTLVYGLGPLVAGALGKIALNTSKNLYRDFRDLSGLTTESQAQARVQSEIVSLYRAGGAALQQQLASMSSLTERAALLQRLLTQTNASGSAAQMAGVLVGQGYRGRGKPRAAEGYVPMAEEAAMISRGVGGAPAGAKPVYLPTFNRGGGQRGIVANTSERIVNMAGGSAIFNEAMIQKMGLPPGSKPVAAGGHIPNAAFGSMMNATPYGYPYNYPGGGGGAFGPGAVKSPITPGGGTPSAMGQGFGQFQDPAAYAALAPALATKAMAEAKALEEATKRQAMLAARVVEFKGSLGTGDAAKSRDFEKAQAELAKADALAARLATKKARELEELAAIGGSGRKRGGPLATSDIQKLDDLTARTMAVIQKSEDAKRLAYIEQTNFARKQERSIREAPIHMGQRSVHEIRPVQMGPLSPFQVTNEGILNAGGGGGLPNRAPVPFNPYGGSRADAERVRKVYRQQMVEEALARRPAEFAAMNERQARLRERLQAHSSEVAVRNLPPPPVAPRPSVWQRMRRGVTPERGALAAAIGLPFAGGMIDEGRGGTAGGIGAGALGGGLTGAGAGASIGLMFGPMGAAIGGGAGLLLGGAVGALKKMEQSFEELAGEINEANAKIQRQVEFVQSAYRLQADVISIIQDPSLSEDQRSAKLKDRRQARTQAILSVDDQKIRKQLMSSINDPDSMSKIIDQLTVSQRNKALADNLQIATRRALDTGGISRGRLGYAESAPDEIAKAILPVLSNLSRTQLLGVGRATANSPFGAFSSVLRGSGMDEKTVHDLTQRSDGNTADLLQKALQKAIHRFVDDGVLKVEEGSKRAEEAAARFGKSLRELGSQLEVQSRQVLIEADAAQRVSRVRQQALFGRGIFTEGQQIAAEGLASRFDIATTFQAQRKSHIVGGRAELIRSLGDDVRGKDSEALRDRLTGLNSTADFERLYTQSSKGNIPGLPGVASEKFRDTLERLVTTLKDLDTAQDAQLRANADETKVRVQAWKRLGTMEGAMDQDQGAIALADETFMRARARNDDPRFLAEAFFSLQTAQANARRRRGEMSQGEFDALALKGNLTVDTIKREGNNKAFMSLGDSTLLSGRDVTSAGLDQAALLGQRGDASGSFLGGFRAVMDGAKRDLMDFSRMGAQVAENLNGSFTDFWTQWATGATRGKEAFKGFVASVLSDASRMLASKAFTAAITAIPGFSGIGAASGGRLGFAAGGMVPAMLTGGEFVFGPRAAKQVGYDTLRRMNGYNKGGEVQHLAGGGMVRGGSGVKDDVPANLPSGSFVIRKSAVSKLGAGYLQALANGRVQRRFLGGLLGTTLGGALTGAVVGGGIGYATGGKQGAIGGALLGGIAGGLYGYNAGGVRMDPTTGQRATLSIGTKATLGIGASAGLGLLAGGITRPDKEPGPISLSQVPAFRAGHEAWDAKQMARKPGQHAFLEINPQGGYSLAGVGTGPATRRWNDGGGADVPMFSAPSMPSMPISSGGGGSAAPQVYIKIDVNNEGQATSSKSGGEPFGEGSAGRLEKTVKGWVQEEIVRQSRADGFFTQRSRYVN